MLMLLACEATAQNSIPLSGNSPALNLRYVLLLVDNGTTAASVTVDVSLTTTSPDGIFAELMDADSYATDAMNAPDTDTVTSAGTINLSVTTPSRSGKQYFLLGVLASDFQSAVDYNGTATTSVNTVAQAGQFDYPVVGHGTHTSIFNLLLAVDQPITSTATTYRSDVEFLALAPAKPVVFRLEWSGESTTSLRVYDDTSNPPVLLYQYSGPDTLQHSEIIMSSVPILGTAKIRVEQTAYSSTETNDIWTLSVPSGNMIQFAAGQTVPPKKQAAKRSSGPGCSIGKFSTAQFLLLSLVLIGCVARARMTRLGRNSTRYLDSRH